MAKACPRCGIAPVGWNREDCRHCERVHGLMISKLRMWAEWEQLKAAWRELWR